MTLLSRARSLFRRYSSEVERQSSKLDVMSSTLTACSISPDSEPREPNSTSPSAPMDLFLRFGTTAGPRTIVHRDIPLCVASEIASLVIAAGDYAELIDARGGKPMAAHLKALKRKAARAVPSAESATNVIPLSKGNPHGRSNGSQRQT